MKCCVRADSFQENSTALGIHIFPIVTFIACDNKEAHALANVKTGNTNRQCRLCLTERENMHHFCLGHYNRLRSTEQIIGALARNDAAFCSANSIHADVRVKCAILFYVEITLTMFIRHRAHLWIISRQPLVYAAWTYVLCFLQICCTQCSEVWSDIVSFGPWI